MQPETRQKIDALIEKYPQPRGALLPALYLVKAENGFVSSDQAREVAEVFGLQPVDVWEVLTICTNLPCSLRGGRSLLKQIEAHLGVHAGETTSDGRVTLGHEECLGSCGTAPMMRVDGVYHEDLDLTRAKQVIDGLE